MTREEALDRISRPELDEKTLQNEFEYVAHKLDFTVEELRNLFNAPKRTYKDFKKKRYIISTGAYIQRLLGMERRLIK